MDDEGHDMSFGLAKMFSHEQLKDATNNFDSSRVLGSGGFGKVYLGKLHGKMVAVKKLFDDNPRLVEQFLNEVSVLSRIRHQNLVTLHGYTDPRSQELLLVYDFVPNGTVAEHLHGQQSTLTWYMRIQIAIQTAQALAYLHALEPPVIHRDVKTSNILLDDAFNAKVADLGICRLMPWDTTHVTTLPQGTMGYRDPEYERTMRLTDKSDVYSFGVVLLEFISGLQVVDVNRARESSLDDIYLNHMALAKIKVYKLKELVDSKLNYHSDTDSRRMINSVAELACECLRPEGKMRPTMVQVLKALTDIQDKRYKIDDKIVNGAQAYVFSHNELSQATESFHNYRYLGNKTYLGYFDGLTVAVKVRQVKKLSEREKMFNDVKVLSQLRHDNLATLYGSTDPGSKEMLVVYEHVTNGSLGHHLHGSHPELLLQKEDQIEVLLRIAIETAEALSYLHSLDPPVIHHEISTYNIMLDDNYHVKLSGLNLDRDITWTWGYEDPQWSEFFKSTTKYDVFSFGVVLLELISRNEAWVLLKMIQRNELGQLVDKEVNYHLNLDTKKMVDSVAELACRCVQRKGKMRPTMSEVLLALKQIKMSSILPPLSAVTMELRLRSSGKVPEMGILGRAVGVLDTLGSSMTNLNPGSGFMSRFTTRGSKISILAFEVANTIAKASNLLRSLSDESIVFMKEEILKLDGVRELISGDTRELLSIASSDKREELNVFCREVTRFGNLCIDPSWHNLGHYFRRLMGLTPQNQHSKEVETTMQQLLSLANNTFELYHGLLALDRFEQDQRRLWEEKSPPAARQKSLMILHTEQKRQRKHVRTLKKRSLWSRNLEEVVEKLVGIVAFLNLKIVVAFGVTDTNFVDRESINGQTLGASGLALHYANIITKIDNIVSQPLSFPPNIRDTLYHGLPAGVKAVLRTRLQPCDDKEEYTVAQIEVTMEKSLRWMVPLAENTIKSHQAFEWLGEWANIRSEDNNKLTPQHKIFRIQTLHHASKEKTEEHMLELVVWLHHLVIQVKNREFGFKALKPIRSRTQKDPLLPAVPNGCSSTMFELLNEERELGRSKSQQVLSSKEKRGENRYSNKFSAALSLHLERTKVLDILDGLDMLETFPS